MINLIPPSAKKKVVFEYWIRVCSVWFYIWTGALLAGIFIMLPAYVLITSQVSVYEESARTASLKVSSFEDLTKELELANKQAIAVSEGMSTPLVSEYITLLRSLEGDSVTLSEISVARSETKIEPIKIVGTASDRQTLAALRDRLIADPKVESVELPLSNLAKDKDIKFTITVTFKTATS